jgi:transposase
MHIYCGFKPVFSFKDANRNDNNAAEVGANQVVANEPVLPAPNKGKQHLTEEDKLKIIHYHCQHFSARTMEPIIGKDHSTISKFLKFWSKEKKLKKEENRGRKRKLSDRDVRQIVILVKRDPFITIKQIKLAMSHLQCSNKTISTAIKSSGEFNSYWAAVKPFINRTNREKRVKWCLKHRDWSVEKWRRVLFTDESPFCLRFNGKKRVWRGHNQRYQTKHCAPSFKHDDKINVWGGFSAHGTGILHLVNGLMDAPQYVQILQDAARPSADLLFGGQNFLFQQDNDPKHTALVTRRYMRDNNLALMPWPPQSPDLNPIENLWSILDREIMNRRVNSKQELFAAVDTAWRNLSPELLTRLVDSMPARIEAVLKANGGPTRY